MPPIDYGSDEWFAFDVRLRTFASEQVLDAFSAALQADIAAREAIARQDHETDEAMQAAVAAEAALHAVIRAECGELAGLAFGQAAQRRASSAKRL